MKRFVLTIAIITMATIASIAQTAATAAAKAKEQQETSNAEKFSSRSGSLIKKEYLDVGTLQKCKIQVAKYTDLISNQKSSAVRLELEYRSTYSSDTKIAILDEDEIDGLITSFKIMQEKIITTPAANYTEVSFSSRSGFSAGCYSKKDSWNIYLKLEKFDSNSYIFLEKDDLVLILSLLQQAKAKL